MAARRGVSGPVVRTMSIPRAIARYGDSLHAVDATLTRPWLAAKAAPPTSAADSGTRRRNSTIISAVATVAAAAPTRRAQSRFRPPTLSRTGYSGPNTASGRPVKSVSPRPAWRCWAADR